MNKKRTLSIVFILFSLFKINAQNYELGKVSIEQLKEKVNPNDTTASAAILFKKGRTFFSYDVKNGFTVNHAYEFKIKIYKKEGYSYANQKVNYYTGGSNDESVSISKAFTYNLVNDKVEKTKLGKDGEFKEVINKSWSQRKIALPNVKEGSIVEYNIVIRSPYISTLPDWTFQREIPVNYSEYNTFIPEYYTYNAKTRGFVFPKITETTAPKSITWMSKEGSGAQTKYSNEKIDYQETRKKYVLENVPALKDESYVNNIYNYTASISHELSGKRMPNRNYENFATDWESVTKKIYESEDFGTELNKSGYYDKDVDVILKGITIQDEKIIAIYNYVKSRMNWNNNNSYYCDEGVKSAYQNKTGNVAEINLMLTSMLRYAGFDANPVLVSTRANGISFFPSRTAFNYVITAVQYKGGLTLLDATNKNALPNILPLRVLNWNGRLIKKGGTSEAVDLMPTANSVESIILIGVIGEQGKLTGKIRDQYYDYNAFSFRENYNAVAKESYLEKLEKSYDGIEIENYEVLNDKDLAKPVTENFSFTHANATEIIGDKMYFSPMLFFAQTKNPFTQEIREYPVDFVFPTQNKYNISFQLPEGYAVESLPKSAAMAMTDDLGSFKYMLSNELNQLQFSFTVNINSAIISSKDYDVLKAFYKELIDKQNEKIVLKKI